MAKKAAKKKSIGKRSTKMYKNPNASSFTVNVEYGDRIQYTTGSSTPQFQSNTLSYVNVFTMLNAETSFTEMASRFSMYRINGLKIEARSVFEPSSGTNLEHQVLWMGFFPSTTSVYIGLSPVSNYDKSLIMATTQTLMSRKQTFYNNFFEGTGGGGFGTWNSVGSVSNLVGSIQISGTTPRVAFGTTTSVVHVRFIWNITFKEKQLTA